MSSFPPIGDIFDSVGKIRLLKLLSITGELNITAISNKTGINHVRLVKHLEDLKELYIIQEKKFGRIKIYGLNPKSLAADHLKQFFSDWNERCTNQINRYKR